MRIPKEKKEQDVEVNWRDLPGFANVYDYWQSVRRDENLPTASDIDLLALVSWLPEVSLLERVATGEMYYRFYGTAIVERIGQDFTNKNLYSLLPMASRKRLFTAFEAMIHHPCGAIAHYTNHYNAGSQGSMRTLYLPIEVNKAEGIMRVIGIAHREGGSDYAAPIDDTIVATNILSFSWIDIGFGVPDLIP